MSSHPLLRRCLLLLSALLAAGACTAVAARPRVALEVIDRDDASTLPQYPHRGDTWIAGTPGHRYAVRLRNLTGQRVLVVLSVDGVNAVSGEDADPRQAGYVLDPWESAEIAGWRKSLDDIAQFVFTDPGDSYAARTGRPRNIGVIGIAVFEERSAYPRYLHLAPPPPLARAERDQAAAPAESARGAAADAMAAPQSLGTGHGQREWAPVASTDFQRASRHPAQLSQLRYDRPQRLYARGIVPRPRWSRHDDAPRAFPGGFVPDP